MRPSVPRWWFLASLFALAPVSASAASAASATCPVRGANAPVEYPPAMLQAGREGTTVLRVHVDACGRVLDAVVHATAGEPALDEAALRAARGWTLEPASIRAQPDRGGSFVGIVPVQFEADGAADLSPYVALKRNWCDTRMPDRPVAGDDLPAYIEDARPLTGRFETVAAAVRRDAEGAPETLAPGVHRYEVRRDARVETWDLIEGDWPYAPAVIRTRLVHDARRAYFATSVLCPPGGDCQALDALARDLLPGRQPVLAPPPPLPKGESCD